MPKLSVDSLGASRELMLLAVARMVQMLGAGIIIPLIAPLILEIRSPAAVTVLDWSFSLTVEFQTGLVFSLFGLFMGLSQYPAASLSDLTGSRRNVVLGGFLLSGVALLLYSEVVSFPQLLLVRILQGVGAGVATPVLMAMVKEATDSRTRGGSMGLYTAFRILGFGSGPVVGGAVADLYGLTAAFYLGAATIFVATAALALFLPDRRVEVARRSPGEGNLQIYALALGLGGMMVAMSVIIPMEAPILRRIGDSKAGFGVIFSLFVFSRFVFQVPMGVASDRYGKKRFVIAGLSLAAVATAALGYADTAVDFSALRVVQGVASAALIAPAFALAADKASRGSAASQMAFMTMAVSLGGAFGPIVAGALASFSFRAPFLFGGAVLAASAILVLVFVEEGSTPGPSD